MQGVVLVTRNDLCSNNNNNGQKILFLSLLAHEEEVRLSAAQADQSGTSKSEQKLLVPWILSLKEYEGSRIVVHEAIKMPPDMAHTYRKVKR